MKTLTEILGKYPTDKLQNGYGPFYEELFKPIRDSVVSVLEIGIAQGGSLRAWRDYFPHAMIYGIDKELQFVRPFWGKTNGNILAYHEDANDLKSWTNGRYFDIVIDDGSHIDEEIIEAFIALWPTVRPKGYYIIEDVNSSRPTPYTTIDWFSFRSPMAVLGTGEFECLTFRPGMIVMQKR